MQPTRMSVGLGRRRHVAVIAAAVLVVLAWRPIEAANREQQQLMADMRMLQEQNQQLQLAMASLNEVIKALNTAPAGK